MAWTFSFCKRIFWLQQRERWLTSLDFGFVLPLVLNHILTMIDGEDSLTIQLHVHLRLVAQRQPESIHLLVLPDKVSAFDPERWFLGGMAVYLGDRKIVALDPDCSFEKIFIFSLGDSLEHKAVVRAQILFTDKIELVAGGRQRSVMMLLPGRRLHLAVHQAVENHVANNSRALLRSFFKGLHIGRAILHADDGLGVEFSFVGPDFVCADYRVALQ